VPTGAALADFLSSLAPATSILNLSPSLLSVDVTYVVTVNVTNFLGYSSTASASFEVVNANIPIITLPGVQPLTVYVSEAVVLRPSIYFPSCVQPDQMNFVWSFVSGSPTFNLPAASDFSKYVLAVPPFTFSPYTAYNMTLTAYVGTFSTSIPFEIVVLPDDLQVPKHYMSD